MRYITRTGRVIVALMMVLTAVFIAPPNVAEAACAANNAQLGSVTGTFNIPTAGTYRVWSRIKTGTPVTRDSYTLEIDNTHCNITVGDTGIAADTWTWVDYKDGNTATKIELNLSAGSHSFVMYGRETGVKVDRLVFSGNLSCVPTGDGSNCATAITPPASDTTPPSLTLTFPNITTQENNSSNGLVRSVPTILFKPLASDNIGVISQTYKMNNQNISLTAGEYRTASVNGSYAFDGTAGDAAGLTISRNRTLKLRYPDINRDSKVSTYDVLTVLRNFNSTSKLEYDFNDDGVVGTFDPLFVLRSWQP